MSEAEIEKKLSDARKSGALEAYTLVLAMLEKKLMRATADRVREVMREHGVEYQAGKR